MSRSYNLYIEINSTEPYGNNARLILENGWTPCSDGLMIYSPLESVSPRDVEEPCDVARLMDVIRAKESLREDVYFLATHPGLEYCCDFTFSPDGWVLVGLSGESEDFHSVSGVPNFNFYVQSVLRIFFDKGKRIEKFSFGYE